MDVSLAERCGFVETPAMHGREPVCAAVHVLRAEGCEHTAQTSEQSSKCGGGCHGCEGATAKGGSQCSEKAAPTMVLVLLYVLCMWCTAPFAADAARGVAELAAVLQHYGHDVWASVEDDNDNSVLEAMLRLAEAVEAGVCRSQVFWEEACWRGVSGDEVRCELERLEVLHGFLEEVSSCMDLKLQLEDDGRKVCEAAVRNVADCREWLRLHEGVCERALCGVRMDFRTVQRALELCTDYIGFFYRYSHMCAFVYKLYVCGRRTSEQELVEGAAVYDAKLRAMEEYLAGCSLRKYVPRGKERCARQYATLAGVLERCEAVRKELDRLAGEAESAPPGGTVKRGEVVRKKLDRLAGERKTVKKGQSASAKSCMRCACRRRESWRERRSGLRTSRLWRTCLCLRSTAGARFASRCCCTRCRRTGECL